MRQRVTLGRMGGTKMARPLMPRLAGAKLLLCVARLLPGNSAQPPAQIPIQLFHAGHLINEKSHCPASLSK